MDAATGITGLKIDSPKVSNVIKDNNYQLMHITEAPEDVFANYMRAEKAFLEAQYTQFPDVSNDPTYQKYASIEVNGEVVAELDNHGWAQISQNYANLPMEGKSGAIEGPELAQARAEFLAEKLGGKIVMADTALTQSEFKNTKQPSIYVNHSALQQDPAYTKLIKFEQMRTEFLAQKIGQETEQEDSPAQQTTTAADTSADRFLEYMEMSPEEQYFHAFLKRNNLTKEQFDALPKEMKEELITEFKAELEDKIENTHATQDKERNQTG